MLITKRSENILRKCLAYLNDSNDKKNCKKTEEDRGDLRKHAVICRKHANAGKR